MLADLGLTVLREIPVHALGGLLNGAYSLHGGVVRDAGGRIVAHLLTAGPPDLLKQLVPGLNVLTGLVGNGQIYSLAKDVAAVHSAVSTVLSVSIAGTVLSGLGVVTSIAGFAYLSRRLGQVDSRLAGIHAEVEEIKRLIAGHHLSVLKGAVDNLRHAESAMDDESRRGMLLQAKRDFIQSAHHYGDLLVDAGSLSRIELLEDCFTLAFTGGALATSALGMHDVAAADFGDHLAQWRSATRAHVRRHVIGEAPHRLIHESMVDVLPARDATRILDFGTDQNKGWAWVDDLRGERQAAKLAGQERIQFPVPFAPKPAVLPSVRSVQLAQALVAKDGILQASGAHLGFLAQRKLSIQGFAELARKARSELGVEAACIVPS